MPGIKSKINALLAAHVYNLTHALHALEATTRVVPSKKMFLKISRYSQELPVFGSLFNKVTGLKACNFVKK